jgi:hypothetical protein
LLRARPIPKPHNWHRRTSPGGSFQQFLLT